MSPYDFALIGLALIVCVIIYFILTKENVITTNGGKGKGRGKFRYGGLLGLLVGSLALAGLINQNLL